MPRIVVFSDESDRDPQMLWSERIHEANLASRHFRDQLVERLRWAVTDAHHLQSESGVIERNVA